METVLRELEFNQWVLRINLKDLGGFWIKNYLHTSPTLAFQPEERDKIENIVEKIDQSPHLKKLKRRVVGNKYPVLQIDVPIRQMGPRHYSLTQLKNHFVWAKLDEEENQNKDYKNKGQRLFDYLINDDEAQEAIKKTVDKRGYVLEIDDLKKMLFNSSKMKELPRYKRTIHQNTIEDVLSFLELGHPLRSRVKKDETIKVNIPSPLPNEFIKGHYVECAEMNIAPEGSIVEIVNEDLISILRYRKRVNKLVRSYENEIINYLEFKERKVTKSNISRVRNDLERMLMENDQEEDLTIKTIGGELTPEVIVARKKLFEGMGRLTARGKEIGGCEVGPNYEHQRVDLKFEKDVSRYIKFKRMRNEKEIKKETMFIVDWENFEFGTEHAGTVQGAMCWMKNINEVFDRKIKSRGRVRKDRFTETVIEDGYLFVEKIISDTANEINRSGASIMVAYNASYDFLEPRKYGKFEIGSLNREPRKVSTVPFFERVKIHARHVLDPLRAAKAQYGEILPNCKLVTISSKLSEEENFGLEEDELGKIINYRHGREMEIGRRTGNWDHLSRDTISILEKFSGQKIKEIEDLEAAAGELQCFYADTDLEKLIKIIQSDRHDKILKDVSFMSGLFEVDPFLLYHDPKRVDRFLNRAYFERNGTWRSEMMPRFDNIIKAENRARNYYQRHKSKRFPKQKEVGFFEDVYKVYLPLGRFFRDEVRSFMKAMSNENEEHGQIANEMFEYVDSHQDDKLRNFFLSKYEDAVFEWPLKDYIFYKYTEFRYQKLKKEHEIENNETLDDNNVSFFSAIYNRVKYVATENNDVFLLKKLRSSNLDQMSIQSALNHYGPDFVEELGLEDKTLQVLFNLWLSKRNQENRISAVYGINTDEFKRKFDSVYETINNYLDENNLSLVHSQNNVLYLKGDKDKITNREAPFILVDEIEKVFLAEHVSERRKNQSKSGKKIYYPRCGTWEGIKEKEEPMFNLNVFEMECYNEYLETVFSGKQEEAVENFYFSLDALASQNVDKRDLLWYSKNKEQYLGFMDGEKITFCDWDLDKLLFDEDKDKHYFLIEVEGKKRRERFYVEREEDKFFHMEKSKKRIEDEFGKGSYVEVEKKIYVLPLNEFMPDWDMYSSRIGERAEIFFNPLMGKNDAERLVKNALDVESKPMCDWIRKGFKPKKGTLL
ncbi:hypothetical protein HON71_02710 [Candidatus Woesearchaeota archaeon]|jgi:hypothetical protein|nr:hypothetical protein [Candidatus Woesearchaeota archaeon]MBT5341981.1 hypothetical protein [Candidatus Woesearchaeota archaeon]